MFWHTARDDPMFNTIRVISKHQDTQVYGTILPDTLINRKIKDSEAYKQYYAIAFGAKPPKAKTKYKKKACKSDTSPQEKDCSCGLRFQDQNSAKAVPDEQTNKGGGTDGKELVTDQSQGDDDDDDDNYEHDLEDEKDDEDDDDKNDSEETEADDDGDDFVHPNLSTYLNKAEKKKEEEAEMMMMKCSSDQKSSVTAVTPSTVTISPQPPVLIIQTVQQTPDSTTIKPNPTTTLPEIPNFASLFGFEQRVSALETKMSEFKQTSQFADAGSSILGIVDNYLASKMKDDVDVIIKDQVKDQVSKILPKVEKYVTESLGAKVLVRLANQPQSSYANLYNALIDSYNSDKDLFTSYGDVITLKRGREDQDKKKTNLLEIKERVEERRSGKEAESSKEPTHKESKSTSSSKGTSRSRPRSLGKSAHTGEHGQKVDDLEEQSHQEFNTGNDDVSPAKELAQALGTQSSFNEFLATLIDFSAFIMNRLKIDNLTQDVLTGLTYDLMKGGSLCQKYTTSITKTKVAYYGKVKWIEDKVPGRIWSLERVVYDKHAYWGTYHWGPKRQKFYGYDANMETTKDVYSRHMIIAVTSFKIRKFLATVIGMILLFEDKMISYTSLEKATSKDFIDKTLKTCYFS
ncbi:hypothetical protein Tco_0654642 [Tanacetum coccineum]|uniref:Uncharacterized protein n=1 Tax=Tanacetum coccineum TaxID=301880 RepID=A0ABQ4X4A4_9ASTR